MENFFFMYKNLTWLDREARLMAHEMDVNGTLCHRITHRIYYDTVLQSTPKGVILKPELGITDMFGTGFRAHYNRKANALYGYTGARTAFYNVALWLTRETLGDQCMTHVSDTHWILHSPCTVFFYESFLQEQLQIGVDIAREMVRQRKLKEQQKIAKKAKKSVQQIKTVV